RVDPPPRRRSLRHTLRAEEHQLLQVRRTGDRARDPAASEDRRGGWLDRAGDAALRQREKRDAIDAKQRRGARLSLLPGSRSAAAGDRARMDRAAEKRAPGAPGREATALRRD